MKTIVGRHFEFEASHQLPEKNVYGKCSKLHGHRYELTIEVMGEINEEGWVCNFSDVKKIVQEKVISKFDHSSLNDFFKIPTAEVVASNIFNTLEESLKGQNYFLKSVKLYETSKCYVKITK
ncbi:6-carboxytetrahydropterin synthase QueD [Sporolactobacillus shoreicorticis]|uniref:6-carboxy-5,6,7,8-tetrahydropterin synthase n=1 Tax=Sporolactobacillus shoreicorticis TaxID=1923877 RepID=A0ABW5S0Q0_9BACL|nr:6-carboxytetrahydropterin synthase QueD [Sporolactobacillus shoreicorticis]MCO7127527.1 6-carboxytetrahydropterin synthase QueD [Sporolactobacillus shoreicorticis]